MAVLVYIAASHASLWLCWDIMQSGRQHLFGCVELYCSVACNILAMLEYIAEWQASIHLTPACTEQSRQRSGVGHATCRRRTVASASARRLECSCSRSRRRRASSSSSATTCFSLSSVALSICTPSLNLSVPCYPVTQPIMQKPALEHVP